jgi:hypothetical protein
MNWIFFREEPPVLERSGPFDLVAKSHEVFWVLQASGNVVKLLHFDDLWLSPDYSKTEQIRKHWVYEFEKTEFLDGETNEKNLSITAFFEEAKTFTKSDWRFLAAKAALVPKVARFTISREKRVYLGSGKFDELRLEISIISNPRNRTLSLRTIDNTWALEYELKDQEIDLLVENLKFELIEGLHLRLQNQDFDYWVYLAEEIANEAELVPSKPNDLVWDVNEWMK